MKPDLDFEDWLKEIDEIYRDNGYEDDSNDSYVDQTGEEYWAEMYENGLSPMEAYLEETANQDD